MKAKITIGVCCILLLSHGLAFSASNSSVDRAIEQACERIAEDFSNQSYSEINSAAILPLWGEDNDGYVLDTMKSYLAGGPVSLMARSEQEWDKLLGEIEWNVLREDIMNPATVQSFGRIEGCDAIIYGTVRERQINPWKFQAVARMTLHMADVETGQIVWSSRPVRASVWLEWPEIYQHALYHQVVWIVGAIFVVLLVWTAFKKLFRSATRPR